jgi:hypothetical protein
MTTRGGRFLAWPWVLAATLLLASCGAQEPESPQEPADTVAPSRADPAPSPSKSNLAWVSVVDIEGRPLPNMVPIVTDTANAFNKPLAQGPPTGSDGKGAVALPDAERLYVRAWDPTLRTFPNNFHEVFPRAGTETKELSVQMVEGASLEMVLLAPNRQPAAGENAGLMMFHPTEGPWWPGEADADATGKVTFGPLPAGSYTIKVKAIKSGIVDIPGVSLVPGGTTSLGPVVLQ